MSKALILVIPFGVALGLMVPTRPPSAPAAEAAQTGGRRENPAETRIERARNGHFYVHATVNGQLVRFMVDTGATSVALTTEDAKRVGEDFDPNRFDIVGTGASGPVRGQELRIDSVEIQGKRVANVRGAVIEGLDISLLGQSYLSRMGSIEMTGDEMVIRPPA